MKDFIVSKLKIFTARRSRGQSTIMALGLLMTTLVVAPVAIDVPTYYAVQQQLQTATDAAALAGASQLPNGQAAAQSAAYSVAQQNPVGGKTLASSALTYTYPTDSMKVTATTQMPLITAPLMCALGTIQKTCAQGSLQACQQDCTNGSAYACGQVTILTAQGQKNVSAANCSTVTVNAASTAQPAARDTVLVIDTSSSMGVISDNVTLLSSVQSAASSYVSHILALKNPSVDRIGLVNFDQTANLDVHLSSTTDSPNFSNVQTALSKLKLYSGDYWNTNYMLGLQLAINELQTNGRIDADKEIIFMTDGNANLPGDQASINYSANAPYTRCSDMVDNSAAVQALCVHNHGQTVCPVLPSATIPDSAISASATLCGQQYTNAMTAAIDSQTDRAASLGIKISTIRVYNLSIYDTSQEVLQRLLKNPNWSNGSLSYMASTTNGAQFSAQYYDAAGISSIYAQIAQGMHVKLIKNP